MTDEHKQRLQEEVDDAALKLLMEEYAEIEGEALWREFQAAQAAGNLPDAQTRENRNPRRGSAEKNRRMDFLLRLGKCVNRAAIIFLALICLLSPLVMSVEAFKMPVIDYIVTLKQAFTALNFGVNVGLSHNNESIVNLILSVPWPEECSFYGQTQSSIGTIWLDFTHDGNLAMRITLTPANGQVTIDTEDVDQISTQIRNYEVVYLPKDGHRAMWIDSERSLVFDVHAYLLEEDAFWRYVHRLINYLSN